MFYERTAAVVLGLLVLVTTCGASAAGVEHAVDEVAQSELASSHAPGLAVAIVRQGRVILEKGYGSASLGGERSTPHTRFEIGSDTKQFTAAAILQLKEAGKLSLDDHLAKYLPDFPHGEALTIRTLLQQTTGLPDYVATNHFVHISQTSTGSLARIERMVNAPLRFAPGTKWEYSNTNYYALGKLIEQITGQAWQDYATAHLFAPPRMTESGFISQEPQMNNVATGYWTGMDGAQVVTAAPNIGESWTGAAGDIVSTVDDLRRWDDALLHGRIISKADVSLMMMPAVLADGSRDDYGFGWWIDPVQGHTDVYHDGDTFGMSSSNNIFSDLGLQIIVLENLAHDRAAHTAHLIFKAMLACSSSPK